MRCCFHLFSLTPLLYASDGHDDWAVSLAVLGDTGFGSELGDAQRQALDILKKHPEHSDEIIPALLKSLGQWSGSDENKKAILSTLPVYGEKLQSYLPAIRGALGESLAEITSVEDAMKDYDKFDWFHANNRDRNDPSSVKQYNEGRERYLKETKEKLARSSIYEPLWKNIVCSAFPAKDDVEVRRITVPQLWVRMNLYIPARPSPSVATLMTAPAPARLPWLAWNNAVPSPIVGLLVIMPHTVSLTKSAAARPNISGKRVNAPRSSLMMV